jgi:hypothetical protein
MNKRHATTVSALLALALVLGSVAALKTTALGTSARQTNDAAVAAKAHQLAVYEHSLRQALAAKTPALPKVPAVRTAGSAAQAQPRVVYHRPPPVVVVKHVRHGDDGPESAQVGHGDD